MRNVALILTALAAGCSFSTDFDRSYSDTFGPPEPDPLQPWVAGQGDPTQAGNCLTRCEELATCFEDVENCRSDDSLSIATCAQDCYDNRQDTSIGPDLCETIDDSDVQGVFCNEPRQSDVACDTICRVISNEGCKARLTTDSERPAPLAAETIAMECRAACNDDGFRCCITAEYQLFISTGAALDDDDVDDDDLCVRGQACVVGFLQSAVSLPERLASLDLPPASCGDDVDDATVDD